MAGIDLKNLLASIDAAVVHAEHRMSVAVSDAREVCDRYAADALATARTARDLIADLEKQRRPTLAFAGEVEVEADTTLRAATLELDIDRGGVHRPYYGPFWSADRPSAPHVPKGRYRIVTILLACERVGAL